MTDRQDPLPVLNYAAPPERGNAFARMPVLVIVVLSLCVPGLGSLCIRRVRGGLTLVLLWATVPFALMFFGPFWDRTLFPGTPLENKGLYPFIATCFAVFVLSPILAVRDRNRVLRLHDGQQ
jgi:hypothetical protein